MYHDDPVDIGDKQMKNVRLLSRLGKKLLKLESAPVHSHACTGAGLKRPYQSRAFFQQEANAVFLLAVYTLHGHKCKYRKEHRHSADKYPSWNTGPESFMEGFEGHGAFNGNIDAILTFNSNIDAILAIDEFLKGRMHYYAMIFVS
ncbi:MAG: hypothetical protein V3S16_03660 [Candidatus Desulfatibia sp.]|uniref:hypothetical protein n=1 Tax=Candidatus Desulfatibia sp. TaxID=3101189 RepID=UPI002F2D100B